MPDTKNKLNSLSVVIITHNEGSNIVDCINSCQEVSNDVIVIDSYSTDATIELSKKMGARVLQKPWEGYGQAKNYGAELCHNDWILSIDADERLDEKMIKTLLDIELQPHFVYAFKRLNHLGHQRIRFGAWNPDIKERLYHRKYASWSDHNVHEQLLYNNKIQRKLLQGSILHFSINTISDLERKLETYSKLKTGDIIYKKKVTFYPFLFLKAIFRFLKEYIFKLGLLDGKNGFQIAKANALSILKRGKYQEKS